MQRSSEIATERERSRKSDLYSPAVPHDAEEIAEPPPIYSPKEFRAANDGLNRGDAANVKRPLRVLIVEDSEFDSYLVLALLRKGGYAPEFERVQTADELREALHSKTWDLILADYNLPEFSALAALQILQESGLDLPFIIVSGEIGENTDCGHCRKAPVIRIFSTELPTTVPCGRCSQGRIGRG